MICTLAALGCDHARAQPANVVESADDAFGSRVGGETLGLYSESLVRGFSPQDSGNFLVGDAYFVQAGGLTDAVLASTSIRVGPNALAFDHPAPSGVIQYQLLDDVEERSEWQIGSADLAQAQLRPYVRGYAIRRDASGTATLAAGVVAFPQEKYPDGSSGEYLSAGIVPRWRPTGSTSITAVVQASGWLRQGDIGFVPRGASNLPHIERRRYFGQPWGETLSIDRNAGLIARQALGDTWAAQASTILSSRDVPRSAFFLFTDVDPDGSADGSVIVGAGREIVARAHELRLERRWNGTASRTRLDLSARARSSDVQDPRTTSVRIGRVRFAAGVPSLPDPGAPTNTAGSNAIDQHFVGAGLQHRRSDGWSVTAGLRRAELEQSNRAPGQSPARIDDATWLYNASVVAPMTDALSAFVATTRGIEEAGTAPQNASNRSQILAPAESRQTEVGAKWQAGPMTLIATAFDLSRPNAGLRDDGRFDYIGTVRHRGLEASLSGRIADEWTVVLGALAMRPRVEQDSGTAVAAGDRAVGRSARLAVASVNYQATGSPWSFDGVWNYNGPRATDPLGRVETPGFSTLALGLRYRFRWFDDDAVLRLRFSNVTDRDAWFVGPSGLQNYTAPRRVDLLFTVTH